MMPPAHVATQRYDAIAYVLGATDNAYFAYTSLKQIGIPAKVLADHDSPVFGYESVEHCPDPASRDQMISFLNSMASQETCAAIVAIPTTDAFSIFLACSGGLLDNRILYSVPSISVTEACTNKMAFDKLCTSIPLPRPKTFVLNTEDDYSSQRDRIQFPVALKPAMPGTIPKSVIPKVLLLDDSDAFLRVAQKIWSLGLPVFCQEFIPGPHSRVFFAGGYIDTHHHTQEVFIGQKLQAYPPVGGTTTHCRLAWNDDILRLTTLFAESTKYRGMIDIEFKFDERDRTFKIIEVNPRIGQWHLLSNNVAGSIIAYYFGAMLGDQGRRLVTDYRLNPDGTEWIYKHMHLVASTEQYGVMRGTSKWLRDIRSHALVKTPHPDPRRLLHVTRIALGHIRSRLLAPLRPSASRHWHKLHSRLRRREYGYLLKRVLPGGNPLFYAGMQQIFCLTKPETLETLHHIASARSKSRIAIADDTLLKCLCETFPNSKAIFLQRATRGDRCYTVLSEDKIVGYVWVIGPSNQFQTNSLWVLHPSQGEGVWCHDIFISPEYRMKGLFVLLLHRVLSDFRKQKVTTLYGETHQGNAPSTRAHLACGYSVIHAVRYISLFGLKMYIVQNQQSKRRDISFKYSLRPKKHHL